MSNTFYDRIYYYAHNAWIGKVVRTRNFLAGAEQAQSLTYQARRHIEEARRHLKLAEDDIRKFRVDNGEITNLDVKRAERRSKRRV